MFYITYYAIEALKYHVQSTACKRIACYRIFSDFLVQATILRTVTFAENFCSIIIFKSSQLSFHFYNDRKLLSYLIYFQCTLNGTLVSIICLASYF